AVDVPGTEGGEPEPGAAPEAAPAAKETPAAGTRQPVLVGYGVKPGSTSRRPRKKPPTRPGSYPVTPSAPPAAGPPPGPAFPAGIKLPPGIPAPPQPAGGTKADQRPQPPGT